MQLKHPNFPRIFSSHWSGEFHKSLLSQIFLTLHKSLSNFSRNDFFKCKIYISNLWNYAGKKSVWIFTPPFPFLLRTLTISDFAGSFCMPNEINFARDSLCDRSSTSSNRFLEDGFTATNISSIIALIFNI